MGRIFETRKATMQKRWGRMAKAFARVAKEIAIAAKGGANPDYNPALRRALQNARAVNMPKEKVEAAVARASGVDSTHYEVVVYEGYGPHGIALLVETATDNVVRTVANVRMHFRDWGGNLGSTGSVAFLFEHSGVFRLDATGLDRDALELELIDHGLTELEPIADEEGKPELLLHCRFSDFGTLQAELEKRKLTVRSAESAYLPLNPVDLSESQADEVLKLVDALEEDDDVQRVFCTLK